MLSERGLIEGIARRALGTAPDLVRGIGDDCAVIGGPGETVWLLSTDSLVAGVHFDLTWHPPRQLGRKAVAVNLSDVAAMGGTPRFLLLSLGLPRDLDAEVTNELLDGITEACEEDGCLLVGGDTVHSPGGLLLNLTVVGQQTADEVLYRHGARPGDIIWVSGCLGSAAAGLELCRRGLVADEHFAPLIGAHLAPRPRCRLGRALARGRLAHAMQDISDGIATDLAHLCLASGVGALIQEAALPAHPLLTEAADRCGLVPTNLMLRGGEDYELLWTAAAEDTPAIVHLAQTLDTPCRSIGTLREGSGLCLIHRDRYAAGADSTDITFQGYDHILNICA